MAIMKSKDGKNLVVDCDCGCDEGFRIRVKEDYDSFVFLSYLNGNFYRDQNEKFWRVFCKKCKKIWRIIRNKDYMYSEIIMNKNDFKEFQEYIKNINCEDL